MRRRMIALLLGSVSTFGLAAPSAHALLGVGDIVIDPTNLVQNILTATHTLEQINNQIQQLQHEAQMLVNQAEDLKRLDYASIEHLKRLLERIDTLMREAGEVTYEVEQSERQAVMSGMMDLVRPDPELVFNYAETYIDNGMIAP